MLNVQPDKIISLDIGLPIALLVQFNKPKAYKPDNARLTCHISNKMFSLFVRKNIFLPLKPSLSLTFRFVRHCCQFVERIVRIAREYGREVAAPREAREILGLRKK